MKEEIIKAYKAAGLSEDRLKKEKEKFLGTTEIVVSEKTDEKRVTKKGRWLRVAAAVAAIGILVGIPIATGSRSEYSLWNDYGDWDAYLSQDIKLPEQIAEYTINPEGFCITRQTDEGHMKKEDHIYYQYYKAEYSDGAKEYVEDEWGHGYTDISTSFTITFGKANGEKGDEWNKYFPFEMDTMEPDFSRGTIATETNGGIADIECLEYKGLKIWIYDYIRRQDDTEANWEFPEDMSPQHKKFVEEYRWEEFRDAAAFWYDPEINTFFHIGDTTGIYRAHPAWNAPDADWETYWERDYCELTREEAFEYAKAVIDMSR